MIAGPAGACDGLAIASGDLRGDWPARLAFCSDCASCGLTLAASGIDTRPTGLAPAGQALSV
jgi:hypothetical protein